MNLHPDDHVLLKRCGFSDAHIRKHAQKFYNLTHVCPLRENELRRMSELVAERRMLMDALEHLRNEAENSPVSVVPSTTVISVAGSALAKARGAMTDHLVDANKKVLTEEEIISMAVSALSDFAKYVIARERETCAKTCESIATTPSSLWSESGCWAHAAEACAAEIRERS